MIAEGISSLYLFFYDEKKGHLKKMCSQYLQETKEVQDIKEIEITDQVTNKGTDENITDANSRKRERRNSPAKRLTAAK